MDRAYTRRASNHVQEALDSLDAAINALDEGNQDWGKDDRWALETMNRIEDLRCKLRTIKWTDIGGIAACGV